MRVSWPARNNECDIVSWIDVREGDVGRPRVTRLLGVGVEPLHEVMDDELQLLDRRCGDVDLVTLFQQPLVREKTSRSSAASPVMIRTLGMSTSEG
jgi:hypothetical protein